MTRTCAAFCIVLIILCTSGCGGERETTITGSNKWHTFDRGLALARREGKPVLIDFYTTWCRWCKVMDQKTFSKPEVNSYLAEHFITIKINAESSKERYEYQDEMYTPAELTRLFKIRGFPSLVYLDERGELITVVPGYQTPERLLPFLGYIKKGCYKQLISFEEYLRDDSDCS